MHKSTYIVYTKAFQVLKYPLQKDYLNNIREAFKPLFSKEYNPHISFIRSHYIENSKYDIGGKQSHPDGQLCYDKSWPFIKGIGCVKFVFPEGQSKCKCFKDISTDFFRKLSYDVADQRMSMLYYSLNTPLHIKAYEKKRCVAMGKVFIHIYSSGFVILNIAISLPAQEYSNFEDVVPVINKLSPNFKNKIIPWEWRSKLGKGSLGEIILKVEKNISNSLFEEGRFEFSSDWYKSIKIQSDQSIDYYKNILLGEKDEPHIIDDLKYFPPGYSYSLRCNGDEFDWRIEESDDNHSDFIIFTKKQTIHHFNSEINSEYSLHTFWRHHSIFENIIIKKLIYLRYADYLSEQIDTLKLYKLDKLEQFREDFLGKYSVFNTFIHNHLGYLDKEVKKLNSFERQIYTNYSISGGFQDVHSKLKPIKQRWEKECIEYKPLFKNFYNILNKIFKF